MSSSAANPQHEPTMEEILASIRKIISEDQPEGAKPAPASPPTSLRAVPSEPAPAASPATAAASSDSDVLDLTEEVAEEEEEEEKKPPAKLPIHDDIAFEDDDPPQSEPAPLPVAAEADSSPEDDDLISSSTRSLVNRAFANMDKGPVKYAPPATGTLDAIVEAGRRLGIPLQDQPRFKSLIASPLKVAYPDGNFACINDSETLRTESDFKKHYDDGSAVGPHVYRAGFIEGRGKGIRIGRWTHPALDGVGDWPLAPRTRHSRSRDRVARRPRSSSAAWPAMASRRGPAPPGDRT
jgi:hypothetical protein